MSFQRAILILSVLFCSCLPTFAADSQKSIPKQVAFNINFLEMDRDAYIFLHSLELMKNGNSRDVQNYMEYMLDAIVCAAWDKQEEMHEGQKKRAMEALRGIKEYRAKNPRGSSMAVDTQQFYKYNEPYTASYSQRADEILAKLE